MQKRILTQEDLDNNRELANEGLKVGDEVEVPEDGEQNEVAEVQALSPLAAIIKSISELSQADRMVLYGRINILSNHDKDKYSAGVDADPGIFEQAIKSL